MMTNFLEATHQHGVRTERGSCDSIDISTRACQQEERRRVDEKWVGAPVGWPIFSRKCRRTGHANASYGAEAGVQQLQRVDVDACRGWSVERGTVRTCALQARHSAAVVPLRGCRSQRVTTGGAGVIRGCREVP